MDIQVTPGAGGQVNINANTNYQVTVGNFISCIVTSPNSVIFSGVYSYNSYLYAIFTEGNGTTPYTSQITLRIFYI